MAIKRAKRETNFTMMSNVGLRDKRLSFKAKGLLAYMLSLPDDWVFYEEEITKHSTDGKQSVRTGLKELQQLGYLIKNQSREKGKFAKVDWLLYDEPGNVDIQVFLPQTEKRSTDNPPTENPPTENQPLLSTNVTKDLNNKEVPSIPYSKIVAYLNDKTGKSYRAVGKNKELIKARWNEGYTLEDFERVIDNKVATWKGVTFQDGTLGDRYLQPTTLFGGKFDGYLNETQPKKASKTIDEEMGGNDKYQQYLERKGLAAANNQQPTA